MIEGESEDQVIPKVLDMSDRSRDVSMLPSESGSTVPDGLGLAYCVVFLATSDVSSRQRLRSAGRTTTSSRRARLILGWVIVCALWAGKPSWYNQPPRSTQPFILPGSINKYRQHAGVKV